MRRACTCNGCPTKSNTSPTRSATTSCAPCALMAMHSTAFRRGDPRRRFSSIQKRERYTAARIGGTLRAPQSGIDAVQGQKRLTSCGVRHRQSNRRRMRVVRRRAAEAAANLVQRSVRGCVLERIIGGRSRVRKQRGATNIVAGGAGTRRRSGRVAAGFQSKRSIVQQCERGGRAANGTV